jgi:H+/Cl- antiporter ClcA
MDIKENIKKKAPDFLRAVVISLLTGAVCGLVGTGFVKSISFVTDLRGNNGWILYLLPVFGLVITLVYNLLKEKGIGTNHIIKSVRTDEKVSPLLSVAVFIGTVLSHFGGASVGREGAALQLGGSIGEFFAEKFKISEDYRRILVMSGMSGCFSALFGTPLAAFVFVLEVARVGKRCFKAIIPAFVSSIIAFLIANNLGVEPEHFPVNEIPTLTIGILWRFVLIAVVGALVSWIFVYALHFSERYFEKIFKNEYIRVVVGGVIVIALTKFLGTTDYNGGGVNIIHHIFTHSEVNYEAFLLKIIFTAISVGAGYKGGEIVPTLFVGSTLGGTIACVLGLNPAFGAAVGITALFCGVTNAPFATVVLACEMFGVEGVGYYLVASAISFALSGKVSLYNGRKMPFVQDK